MYTSRFTGESESGDSQESHPYYTPAGSETPFSLNNTLFTLYSNQIFKMGELTSLRLNKTSKHNTITTNTTMSQPVFSPLASLFVCISLPMFNFLKKLIKDHLET